MLNKFCCLLLLLFSVSSLANEKKPENESTVFNETFSWQAQMGFSLQYSKDMLEGIKQSDIDDFINISLLLDFYYKGFFIQSNQRRADTFNLGAEMGYQLLVEDDWELDIISKSYIAGFIPADLIEQTGEENPALDGLKERHFGGGVGIRYSRYFSDGYLSLDIAKLNKTDGDKGWLIDAFYSQLNPYRNWDIYLNAGITLYSSATVDYYVGIDKSEVSDARYYYQPGPAAKIQFELFAQHPISESWTFNAGFSQSYYTANVTNSPIIDARGATQIMMGVLYVF